MKTLGCIVAAVAIFGLGIWWEIYKFNDCRMVGHSQLYCVGSIGR